MIRNIRRTENLHILLWLLKDTCWVLSLKTEGVIMIFPTMTVAIYITWRTRRIYSELLHNLAVCSWIMANSTWMLGEFFYKDKTRPIALVFFILGLSFVATYYLFFAKKEKHLQGQDIDFS
jgi:ABC-type Mn2+/Zn2+ transport system permease subunit